MEEGNTNGVPLEWEKPKITCSFVSALHCSIHLHEMNTQKEILVHIVQISKITPLDSPSCRGQLLTILLYAALLWAHFER